MKLDCRSIKRIPDTAAAPVSPPCLSWRADNNKTSLSWSSEGLHSTVGLKGKCILEALGPVYSFLKQPHLFHTANHLHSSVFCLLCGQRRQVLYVCLCLANSRLPYLQHCKRKKEKERAWFSFGNVFCSSPKPSWGRFCPKLISVPLSLPKAGVNVAGSTACICSTLMTASVCQHHLGDQQKEWGD